MASTTSADLTAAHEQNVRPWLDLIDTLRAQGVHEDLPLPQIAVMGDQSSGKSSVLEALSGVPFPRGTGLVTRCPTQLLMKRSAPGTSWKATASISRSQANRRGGADTQTRSVASPGQLTDVIVKLTDALTASQPYGFSQDAIVIHVTAPDVPDLTLIDLPGIVRTSTSGQDSSVIQEVNNLINSYLIQERTIILAVLPANQDIATCDILERAAQVDPTGERTIGVLTKPDLVGPGSEDEVIAVLNNVSKPLKLGYVMVKNRTQKELADGQSLSDAKETEAKFFADHAIFSRSNPLNLGVANLTIRLTDLLVRRIKTVLPVMKFEVQEMQAEAGRQLTLIGREAPTAPLERMNMLMKLVAEYCALLRNAVRGDYRAGILADKPNLRLRTIADKTFRILGDKIRETQPDFDSPAFSTTLEAEIRGLRGRELPGLVNSYFFYSFMVTKLEDWREPVDTARQEVFDTVNAIGANLFRELCPQYPYLANCVATVLKGWVERHVPVMETRIEEAFKQEEDPFVSTNELSDEIVRVRAERFDRALNVVVKAAGEGSSKKKGAAAVEELDAFKNHMSEHLGQWYMANHGVSAAALIEDMRTVLTAYWRLSAKRLTENVCMSVEAHVLTRLSDDIESELLSVMQIKTPELVAELFHEPSEVTDERQILQAKKAKFDKAVATIQELAPDVVAVSRASYREARKAANAARKKQREQQQALWRQQQALYEEERPRQPPPAGAGGGGGGGGGRVPQQQQRQPRPQQPVEAPVVDDEPMAVFEFTGKSGDNNGYIYWLGTEAKSKKFENPHDGGRLRVTSSGMSVGTESGVVSRKRNEIIVSAGPDVWLCLDLGRSRIFSPTHCTMCHGSAAGGYDLNQCFTFEAHDPAAGTWVDISTRGQGPPHELKSPHGVNTFALNAGGRRFRYMRIRMTGKNGRGDNSLPICAFEFYGRLYRVEKR